MANNQASFSPPVVFPEPIMIKKGNSQINAMRPKITSMPKFEASMLCCIKIRLVRFLFHSLFYIAAAGFIVIFQVVLI